MTDTGEVLASDAEREGMCAQLEAACVEGRLTLEDFSERVGAALTARTRGELEEIGRGLPALAVRDVPVASERMRGASSVSAILGSADRTGHWRIGEHVRVQVLAGNCKLDLRGATISSRVTTIEANVIAGDFHVIVPEGIEVDLEMNVLAASRTLRLAGAPPPPGAPIVRITGRVIAGSVTVRDQAPLGERVRESISRILSEG
jgi:hypothetical protein